MPEKIKTATSKKSSKMPEKIVASTKKPLNSSEKATKTTTKTRKITMNNNKNDLATIYAMDFGNNKLKPRQRAFIYFYTNPDAGCYHNGAESARRAGYTNKKANDAAAQLLKDTGIRDIVDRLQNEVTSKLIDDEYHVIMEMKKKRIHFNAKDFFRTAESYDKDGNLRTRQAMIPINELPEDLQMLIDGIDYKGQQGIETYVLPNRHAEMNEIIALYERRHREKKDDNGGFDVEATAEVIKGKVELKTKIITRNKDIEEKAFGFQADGGKELPEEE
jgi:hypothetical protein